LNNALVANVETDEIDAVCEVRGRPKNSMYSRRELPVIDSRYPLALKVIHLEQHVFGPGQIVVESDRTIAGIGFGCENEVHRAGPLKRPQATFEIDGIEIATIAPASFRHVGEIDRIARLEILRAFRSASAGIDAILPPAR